MSRRLLSAWNNTVRRCGNRVAVIEAGTGLTTTFAELESRSSAWLAGQGAAAAPLRGRAVVFAVPNGVAWLELFLGLLKAGAIALPLDAAEPPAARRKMAEALHAGFLWEGGVLIALPRAKSIRNPGLTLIKLTSGSTGAPRALPFTDAQLLADARSVTATMGIRSRDLNYALIPLGHSYGLGNLTIPLIARGIPLVCGTAPLPHAIADDFSRWHPTVFPGVPAMWRALATSDLKLPGLRLAISAGALLPPEVAAEFFRRFGQRLHNFYGSSETGGIAYDRNGFSTLRGGTGTAMRDVSLRLRRGSRLEVSGPAVFTQGNRRRHKKTGAWIMADEVEIDARGGLTLRGRRGRTVKIAGRRVNLREVTARLRRLDGVQDAWVGITGDANPILGAVVATQKRPEVLRAALLTDTAPWKIPKKWIVLRELPLTERGKTDVRALQAMLA